MPCTNPAELNTIEITNCYINSSLDLLVIDALTCGTFVELYAYLGSGFLYNIGVDLSSHLSAQSNGAVHLELTSDDLGLGANVPIDDAIIIRFVNERTFASSPTINETKLAAAISYASIYPCLINKIDNADEGCDDCASLNNALILNLLMEAVNIYVQYERFSDAITTYLRMNEVCAEYHLLYKTDASHCSLYGGIGCWIINNTFNVTSSFFAPA